MLARTRKSLVAVAGALASLAALGILPSPYQEIAVALVAVATAAGVFAVPNALTIAQRVELAAAKRVNGHG